MTVDHTGQHIAQISGRLDANQLAPFHQAADDRPAYAFAVAPGEQTVLATECHRPDRALDGVRIEFNSPVVQESGEAGPSQDWSDLMVQPPPIYVQEKLHPKSIIATCSANPPQAAPPPPTPDLFANLNGLPDPEARLEFYRHDQHWFNRMILGDRLQVMASLAEREGLRGKVQCIHFDPPYGIKFDSNWQVSTQSRDVKDGKQTDFSRKPEQVKAFRDTWKEGIHSHLTYLRDRLTVARELLTEAGRLPCSGIQLISLRRRHGTGEIEGT